MKTILLHNSKMKSLTKAILKYKEQAEMTKVLERRWLAMFLELVDYKKKNGDTNVPARYSQNTALGYWVRRQRLVYAEGKIDPARKELLNLIGFRFRLIDIHDWDEMYEKLCNFKELHGHVNITESFHDSQLHNWLLYQRKQYWKGKLDGKKIQSLKALGVDMRNKTINRWEEKFELLVQFKREHGHLHVCTSYGANKELISFVKVLRRSQARMSETKKKLLEDLGFNWNPQNTVTTLLNQERANAQWFQRFNELKQYKQKFGTTYIRTTSNTHKSLAAWVSVQRNGISKMSKERISLLNEIGFFIDNDTFRKAQSK